MTHRWRSNNNNRLVAFDGLRHGSVGQSSPARGKKGPNGEALQPASQHKSANGA